MDFLTIRSGQHDYTVNFHENLDVMIKTISGQSLHGIVIDRNVANLYRFQLESLLQRFPVCFIDALEEEKTLQGIEKTLSFYSESNFTRQSIVLAIGGGIIQDIVTFSSHIYYRGIRWLFMPTTLLSMGDSCIGAKCGINFKNNKNQLGIFHSPSGVHICPEFIQTLEERDVRSGYGEILKLMLTGRRGLFENYSKAFSTGFPSIEEARKFIFDSLCVKKQIIEEDEYELSYRRILNYGHTFGHALEGLTHYEIPHGSAVAWGLDLANYLSWKLSYLSENDFQTIHAFVFEHFRFHLSHSVNIDDLITATKRDKKVAQGKANLILLRSPGNLEIVQVEYDEQLTRLVTDYFHEYNVIYWD